MKTRYLVYKRTIQGVDFWTIIYNAYYGPIFFHPDESNKMEIYELNTDTGELIKLSTVYK
jgi:hypothetical protein